jgi:nitroimidazol reductase NimA-like FMN-containing flavoprotein (pyridoxamine 5'-phosphate oxidase superfamily)
MRMARQEEKDKDLIRAFIQANEYCMLSVVDGDKPYSVPLNFGFTMEEDGKLTLYVHTSKGGRLYDILHAKPQGDIPVAFSMVSLEGVLRFEHACDWDLVYQSLLGEGNLVIVTETADKEAALSCLMDCLGAQPGYSFSPARVNATTVYRVDVTDYHMKKSKKDASHLQK